MKRLVLAAMVVCAGMVLADEGAAPVRRRRPSRPSGGLLERKSVIPSKQIGVLGTQKLVAAEVVAEQAQKARILTNLPFKMGDEKAPVRIELIESDAAGTLALYPEEFRATINVKALAADGAAADVVAERVQKELARAGLFLLGSGYSPTPCLARPVANLKELDELKLVTPSPDSLTHLKASAKVGVDQIRFATYRDACREGWAPAPTNDVQKVIWEEYHAKPTKPMKIEFDPKKGE